MSISHNLKIGPVVFAKSTVTTKDVFAKACANPECEFAKKKGFTSEQIAKNEKFCPFCGQLLVDCKVGERRVETPDWDTVMDAINGERLCPCSNMVMPDQYKDYTAYVGNIRRDGTRRIDDQTNYTELLNQIDVEAEIYNFVDFYQPELAVFREIFEDVKIEFVIATYLS